jgi:hypothetical protein
MPLDPPAEPTSNLDLALKGLLPVILSCLDDTRRIIEGGKGRRWEVFKWAFALNILLVSVTVARDQLPISAHALLVAAMVTSAMAGLLIDHYDNRMDGARERADRLYAWLRSNAIDVLAVMGEPAPRTRAEHEDGPEKTIFFLGIFLSLLAVVIAVSTK